MSLRLTTNNENFQTFKPSNFPWPGQDGLTYFQRSVHERHARHQQRKPCNLTTLQLSNLFS
jgi:hypothetical protein